MIAVMKPEEKSSNNHYDCENQQPASDARIFQRARPSRWSVLRRSLALGLSGRFSRRLLFNLRLSFCGSRVHENRPLSFAVEQLDAPNGSCQVSARLVVFIKRRNAVFVRAGESA